MWPHTLPSAVTIPLTMFVVALGVARIVLVRGNTEADRLVNTVAVICATGVALREPEIAERAACVVPGGLPVLFDLWHWTTVSSWACGMGLLLAREYGPVRYRTRFRAVLVVAVAIGVGFLVLGTPARAQGISIAEYGGWRYEVYVGLLSTPPVFVSMFLLRTLMVLRHRVTTRRERRVVWILFVVAGLSVVPASSFLLFTTLDAAGLATTWSERLLRFTSDGLASGEPQLLSGAIMLLVLIPSCARALVRVSMARRLLPMWRELTQAVPGVVLRLRWADRWGAWPTERLERLRVEIRDAAEILARYATPLPAPIDELIDATVAEADQEDLRCVAELVLAARHRAASGAVIGEAVVRVSDVPDETVLLRWWASAKSLVDKAKPPSHAVPVRRSPN